jgi:hypothetical protein
MKEADMKLEEAGSRAVLEDYAKLEIRVMALMQKNLSEGQTSKPGSDRGLYIGLTNPRPTA